MKKNKSYLKNYILFLLVFIAVTVLFHFAAGQQLYYRQTAAGMEEVWTGKHYNRLVVAAWMMFTLLYVYSAWRFENGKWDLIFTTAAAFKKYGFLISQLVERDFKVRYKRSFLGVLWSLLNPLLMMTVQYIVFSQLFRSDIDNFPIYMLTGLVVFNFFTEAVGLSLGSIVWNASLITKVYVPKYMYPVTKVLSSTINFVLSMILIFVGMVLTGESFTKALILLPYLFVCVIGFTMGLSMLLSALMVFFRDIQFLWGIVSMLWMYLTALFYPISIIPENFRWVFEWNPMYCYVAFARKIFMDGIAPEPRTFAAAAMYAAGSLLLGGVVFKRLQDHFVLNL
ncbi:ABC transporter permease [Lachnoclostridium pacaense]|uniref:ABC transporter permease n=1 Tax=Enterocloster hominis (ex Hitch et al. 2024) TaxID=1917870 RepID=UPI001D0FB325|nr:ABC transporter permease [Lachnoclostridium pacaense]MCC2878548.1 ABC transporter permease [Lachnoclostridium pacaense]